MIRRLYIQNLNEKRNQISIYAKNFIVCNVLPIFKHDNISGNILDIIKFNISEILEGIGMNKNYYSNFYFPQFQKKIKNRQKSIEEAASFRKEFNIGEEDIYEEALIIKLDQNDNDIYQTFQELFGK